ncbi:MAG TPA: YbjN domain-containing protein [Thermoanaerobaculia bacterium]|nr:YbjN domain-containing protein [Thermoanaerobaculia bacterium]
MFEHAIQEETFGKVKEYLGELFEEPYHDPENDHFYVRYGTTVLEISVEPYGPEEAMVTIMSYCVQDVEVEDDLLLGLLELNHQLLCGSFSVVGNDIFFAHSLFGSSLEPRDLLRAITSVATLADDYDDRIVARYGGQTALEKIQDTGGWKKRAGDTM